MLDSARGAPALPLQSDRVAHRGHERAQHERRVQRRLRHHTSASPRARPRKGAPSPPRACTTTNMWIGKKSSAPSGRDAFARRRLACWHGGVGVGVGGGGVRSASQRETAQPPRTVVYIARAEQSSAFSLKFVRSRDARFAVQPRRAAPGARAHKRGPHGLVHLL